MREIIFKAKRVDNGEWVEGDLIHGQGHKLGEIYILPQTQFYPAGCSDLDGWHVDPETVCQFTGLLDKNGKKIFEGDVVRCFCDSPDPYFENTVVWKNGSFGYKSNWTGFISFDGNQNFEWENDKSIYAEIIGNIHDKKEGTQCQ